MAAAAAVDTDNNDISPLAQGFIAAANSNLIPGENGGALVDENDPLVAAFNDMVRSVTDDRIRELVRNMVARVKQLSVTNKEEGLEYLQNIFKLIFHKRCIHYHTSEEDSRSDKGKERQSKPGGNASGEGEKYIFFRCIIELYAFYPGVLMLLY